MRKPERWISTVAFMAVLAAGTSRAWAQAQPPADSGDYLISDFDSANPMGNALRGYWYFYDDQYTPTRNDMIPGNSRFTSFLPDGQPFRDSSGRPDTTGFPAGRSGRTEDRCLRFAYVLGTRMLSCGGSCTFDPFVRFGLIFSTYAATVGLSGAASLSFWARSDSDTVTTDVSVRTRDTTRDASDYAQRFAIGPEWTRYRIILEESDVFRPPGQGARKPFVPQRACGIEFDINRGLNPARPANSLYIDDILIEGWKFRLAVPDPILRRKGPVKSAMTRFTGGSEGIFYFGDPKKRRLRFDAAGKRRFSEP